MQAFKQLAILGCSIILLGGCTQPAQQVPAPPVPIPASTEYPADLRGARLYKLSPEQSMLHILVYRGGAMAHLGHNHVISSRSVAGHVWWHDEPALSGFNITQSVNDLIIDDAQARTEEGEDFRTIVGDSARAGTRANMLKPEQLDGERFPLIRLRSVAMVGDQQHPQVRVRITIKDQSREVTVPVELVRDSQSLRVRGQFSVRQSDFGITPYSVAMGALQVVDQLTIKFDLQALTVR